MSIQSEITRINTNIANAYDAVDTMGGTLPVTQNSANLPDAIATLAQTDYIQLEWVESTGTQYIDTGITPDDNYIIEMTASNHSNDDTAFFGANDTWNSNRLLCYAIYSRVYFRGSGSSYISHDVTSSTPYVIKVSSSSFTVNGANNQPQTTLGAINTTLKFFSGGSRIGKFRFYSAKVWNGNTLVGDYIPVLKKSTYDVGVYNKVDNTFLNNSGLGYFRPGIKIAGYSILDYLQSSGAAWFDTGVSGGSKMEYSMAINTLGSKARNYEQYFAGDVSPVSHKLYLETYNNRNAILARGSSGNATLYTNADAWHTISFYSDGKIYLDNTLKGTLANNGWGTLSYYLFNSHSEPTLISSMRMRYLVMKTDGVIQRFYIPMQKESPQTLGVYDLVNDTFISSASNTAFTANQRLIIDDGTSSPDYPQIIVPTPSTKSGSIADQIDRINENIANAYDVCRQIGRTMPPIENSFYLEPTILDLSFYSVTWENYDGTVLKQELYFAGQIPAYKGITPHRQGDTNNVYVFDGWSPSITPISSDTVYTAQFTLTPYSNSLYYKIDNGTLYLRNDNPGDYNDATTALNADGNREHPAEYYIPWYNSGEQIISVVIENQIIPKNCEKWFDGFINVISFSGMTYLITSGVSSMRFMFASCDSLQTLDLSCFDTYNVTDMGRMFLSCRSLVNINVSSFDTNNVATLHQMFAACRSLTEIDISNFNNVESTYVYDSRDSLTYMFANCVSLNRLDLSNFHIGRFSTIEGMFYGCRSLTYLDLSGFDMSNRRSGQIIDPVEPYAFTGCANVQTAYGWRQLDVNALNSGVQSAGYRWRFTVKS